MIQKSAVLLQRQDARARSRWLCGMGLVMLLMGCGDSQDETFAVGNLSAEVQSSSEDNSVKEKAKHAYITNEKNCMDEYILVSDKKIIEHVSPNRAGRLCVKCSTKEAAIIKKEYRRMMSGEYKERVFCVIEK